MPDRGTKSTDRDRLEQLIEEATVDAHDVAEQATGFLSMLEDNVSLPFTTSVLGVEVSVTAFEFGRDDTIVAMCTAGRQRQRIDLVDLQLPTPPPPGAEWIEAYGLWWRRSVGCD